MKNNGLNYVSKIVLSFLLVLSMILPHFAVVKAETTGAIGVGDAISQFNPASVKPNVTVEGYIVGFAKSETSYVVEAETDTNIAIADTPGETDVTKMLYVQLPNSPASIRAEFGLKTNPGNLGKKVVITGSLEKYFGNHAGLKSPSFIQFVGNDTPNPEEPTQVASIKASPTTGEIYAGTNVTLSTTTQNATIYYTTDGSEPTTESTVYNGSTGIIVDEAMTIKAFATASDLANSEVATFDYTIKTAPTAISIEEARNKAIGEEVIVSGIVTAKLESATAHIQDETGAAIAIYPADSLSANVGDFVSVQGKVDEYSGLKQLTKISLISKSAATLPEPQVVTSIGIAEDNESRLVTLKDIAITGSGQNFTGSDAAGTFAIYDKLRDSGLVSGKTYGEITGIVGQFTNHQLLPIRIIEDTSKVQDIQASHSGYVTAGTSVTLSTLTEGAKIYYTVDGSLPTTASAVYTEPITINDRMTIKAIGVKEGLTGSAVATFVYEIINLENATISEIQGASHTSPYAGLQVNDVDGIVTFVIDGSNFIMQENTPFDGVKSTAIKVNKSSHGVTIGDVVKVTGTVNEAGGNTRLKDTQIAANKIEKTGTAAIPETLVIGEDLLPPNKIIDNDSFAIFDPQEDGIDFWESIEYMLVSFTDARVVGPMYNNDSPIVVPSTTNNTFNANGGLNIAADDYNPEKIMLEGVSGKNYESGDRFNDALIGFVENFSDGYRLNTNKVFPEVTKANIQQEVTHLEPVADKLNFASYNIENFSNNKDNTSDEKAAKIASTFVHNMKSPDIITLVEVQDNDGQTDSGNADASQSYLRLINEIKLAGGPQYDWIDVMPINNTSGGAPGGNIRVGYLYNPERVSLVGGTRGTGTQANAWTEEGSLALNPGFVNPSKFEDTRKPIAAEFEFQEERIVVIGAHLNSKGGDDSLWGPTQPPVLGSEAERIELAQVINDFIVEGLAKEPDVNIVVAGDMNDFEFTPALEALKGNVLTNMVDKAPVEDRFSYYFQGNNQVLDHILVSNNLAEVTEIDMIHINANFTEAQGRASDHDPVLVQIDLKSGKEETPEPIVPENEYNYKNYKTGKLIMNRPSISLTLGENTTIKNGIAVFSEYAEFHGTGFADKTVTISPKKGNAIIDFKGTKIDQIIIEGNHVKEIRNLPSDANITYTKGASPETIEFK
ncbi:chitobiase/beta-hexosaminidase C-terminal domain-containing protein [Solibacillus sp. NPDC093137]|uniref:chitobiase/beta-hexosaminidase C-terminal domain-containing protein n=1 Tax=Solibacillus sp. NPDC093137 TaxID=3390678 RepID=UPI003CFE5505